MTTQTLNHSAIDHFNGFLRHKVPDVLWSFRNVRRTKDRVDSVDEMSERFARFRLLDPECGAVGCAVGLAPTAFPGIRSDLDELAKVLGIPLIDAESLFGFDVRAGNPRWIYGAKTHDQVTRHDVADALERYAREGRWW